MCSADVVTPWGYYVSQSLLVVFWVCKLKGMATCVVFADLGGSGHRRWMETPPPRDPIVD